MRCHGIEHHCMSYTLAHCAGYQLHIIDDPKPKILDVQCKESSLLTCAHHGGDPAGP